MVKNWLLVQASKIKKLTGEKALTLTVTKLNELLVEQLTEALGPDQAFERIFEGGLQLGHEFMMELSAHLDPAFERMPAYGEAAWILFAGKAPTWQQFQKTEIGGKEAYIYQWADDDCPFCRNIRFPHKFCAFPAGAYQGAAQTWSALTRNGEHHMLVRETKCKAIGDNRCEFMLVSVHRDVSLEQLRGEMPELFEDFHYGFVDY